MKTNQQLITEIRAKLIEARRVKAVRERHAKADAERAQAEMTLILDDMQAEGLDLSTPMGIQVFVGIWAHRTGILKWDDDEYIYQRFIKWRD